MNSIRFIYRKKDRIESPVGNWINWFVRLKIFERRKREEEEEKVVSAYVYLLTEHSIPRHLGPCYAEGGIGVRVITIDR